eukprot:5427605-Prymnesium_polylepis.1
MEWRNNKGRRRITDEEAGKRPWEATRPSRHTQNQGGKCSKSDTSSYVGPHPVLSYRGILARRVAHTRPTCGPCTLAVAFSNNLRDLLSLDRPVHATQEPVGCSKP